MSKLTKILLIAIIFIITTFGIMVRKYLGIPIVIKNLILLMIVIPLVKFIWNIPSSKSSQNVFSDTENYQQPFNKWQNNASPQQGDFGGYQTPQTPLQQQGGFYNGGHNAGYQSSQRLNSAPQQPQSPPQQPPRKNNGGDFNGDLYGKSK